MDAVLGTATWWSYADADRTALSVVVVIVALAAVAYVARRITSAVRAGGRRPGRR
jgi:hypothetical protein